MMYGGGCTDSTKEFIENHPEIYPDGTTFMIGNEIGYSGVQYSSEQYATNYHNCYQIIKSINPSYKLATVAMPAYGGSYLTYIEQFRESYNNQYGTYPDIGAYRFHVYTGYNSLTRWVTEMRTKMKEWGDQDKDLIISESCVRDGTIQDNINYLNAAFDYVTTAKDTNIGKPNDDYRLVQKFAWFSLNSGIYPRCSLFNPDQHWNSYPPTKTQLTPVGQAFVNWVNNHT